MPYGIVVNRLLGHVVDCCERSSFSCKTVEMSVGHRPTLVAEKVVVPEIDDYHKRVSAGKES